MLKKWILLLCLMLLAAECDSAPSANPPADSATDQTQSSTLAASNSLQGWENFQDMSGQAIDFDKPDVQSIQLNYALGWSLDSPGYQKIRMNDQVGECSVVRIDASYLLVQDAEQAPTVVCNRNSYQVHCGKALSGVLIADSDGLRFHPYNKEGTAPFLLLCKRSEELEKTFSARSIIEAAPGKTVEIQPVAISIPFSELSGTALEKCLLEALSIETTDAASFQTLTKPYYFDAQLKFSEIVFSAYAQSEGDDFINTIAVGHYDRDTDFATMRTF